jgi:hypothetical protein
MNSIEKAVVMKISTRSICLPLCAMAVLISVASQAADSSQKAPSNPVAMSHSQQEMPFHDDEDMPHHPPMPPMGMMPPPMHGFCHGGELFCASVASDNPTDTLQKLNTVIPAASAGKHYEVRVSVVEVSDAAEQGPQAAGKK